MSDGIEIHFDEKRGYLQLACQPDAFAAYRDIARKQLADFPDISIEKVVELSVTDTATFVARRDAPRRHLINALICTLVVLIFALAAVGAVALVSKLVG
jgi:hypothetical protein